MSQKISLVFRLTPVFAGAMLAAAGYAASAAPFTNGSFETVNNFTANANTGAELVSDGDTTTISDFTVVNQPIILIQQTNGYDNITSSDGEYFLDLTGTQDQASSSGFFGGVTQSFSTSTGSMYKVQFDLGDSAAYDPNVVAGLQVSAAGQLEDVTYTGPSLTGNESGYQTKAFTFTAAGDTTTLEFLGNQGQQYIGLDNVTVTELTVPISTAPEPSTWALMIAGVATIGASVRSASRSGRRPQLRVITPA